MNTVETMARALGAAIQQDERYLKYLEARRANDEDAALNRMIDSLRDLQTAYEIKAAESPADDEAMAKLETEYQDLYGEIMLNANMRVYENAKQDVDDMMNYVVRLLSLCVNGEDPATCEPKPAEGGCTGSCSSCGGCG